MSEFEQSEVQKPVEIPKGKISLKDGYYQGRLTLIRSNVGLPPFLGEFGLNYQSLLNLGRLAGFRTIRIVSNSKDSSEETYNLQGGVSRDGTLSGSVSTATTYIPEAYSDLLYDDDVEGEYVPRGRMWSDLTVNINTREIQKRITNEGKAVNDKNAWGNHISGAIIGEIIKKGTFNLLRSGDLRNDRDAVIDGPIAALVFHSLSDALSLTNPVEILSNPIELLELTIVYLMWFSYVVRLNSRRGNGPARFSLLGVHAPAIDRALALFTSAKAISLNSVVKPINSN